MKKTNDNAIGTKTNEQPHDGNRKVKPLVLCKSCGSGDVRYCQISKSFYCTECNSWPPSNWNDEKYARQKWNEFNAQNR